MCEHHFLRFVTSKPRRKVEVLPWGPHEWLARPGLTAFEAVAAGARHDAARRGARVPPPSVHGGAPLLRRPAARSSGSGAEKRVLKAGEVAHVPMDEVHGTYNVFDEPVVFLADALAGRVRRPRADRRVAGRAVEARSAPSERAADRSTGRSESARRARYSSKKLHTIRGSVSRLVRSPERRLENRRLQRFDPTAGAHSPSTGFRRR
jgi:hypothetical protein